MNCEGGDRRRIGWMVDRLTKHKKSQTMGSAHPSMEQPELLSLIIINSSVITAATTTHKMQTLYIAFSHHHYLPRLMQ